MTRPYARPSVPLEEIRREAYLTEKLPDKFAQALEESLGGKYHGHVKLDLGVVSLFMTLPRRDFINRCHRTLRVDELWGDDSIGAAYLDVDDQGNPLTLDLYPKIPRR